MFSAVTSTLLVYNCSVFLLGFQKTPFEANRLETANLSSVTFLFRVPLYALLVFVHQMPRDLYDFEELLRSQ